MENFGKLPVPSVYWKQKASLAFYMDLPGVEEQGLFLVHPPSGPLLPFCGPRSRYIDQMHFEGIFQGPVRKVQQEVQS